PASHHLRGRLYVTGPYLLLLLRPLRHHCIWCLSVIHGCSMLLLLAIVIPFPLKIFANIGKKALVRSHELLPVPGITVRNPALLRFSTRRSDGTCFEHLWWQGTKNTTADKCAGNRKFF